MDLYISREHIKIALAAAVNSEVERLHGFYDAQELKMKRRHELLNPVLQVLRLLADDVSDSKGIEIDAKDNSYNATVRIIGGGSNARYTLGLDINNENFTLETYINYSWDIEVNERTEKFTTAEDMIAQIIKAVGAHVASSRVMNERHP